MTLAFFVTLCRNTLIKVCNNRKEIMFFVVTGESCYMFYPDDYSYFNTLVVKKIIAEERVLTIYVEEENGR